MAYASAADLRVYLKVADTSEDTTLLAPLIARAQQTIETLSLRKFEGAATTRYFDAVADLYDDGDGWPTLLVLDKDLCSIVSVTNGDGVVISSSNYVTEPRNETPYWGIRLKRSSTVSWVYTDSPENAIAVNGVWAYSATAPADVVQATLDLTVYLYRRRSGDSAMDRPQVTQGGIVLYPPGYPESVKAIIDAYRPKGGGR